VKLPAVIALSLLLLGTVVRAQSYDWSADPLPIVKINTVAFKGWIPTRTEPLRGTLVLIPGRHQDGRGMAAEAGWQGLANDLGFAIVACQFADGEPYDYQGDAQGEVARCINTAVDHLAAESKHVELSKAPLALWGVSAGSNVSERYCSQFPKRVAAFASSTGTCGAGSLAQGKTDIPMFFAIGGKDNPAWVQDSQRNIDAGLKLHAPWAVALNKNAGHGTGHSLDVIIPFLKATVNMRFTAPSASGMSGGSTSGAPSIFKTAPPSFSQSGPKSAAQPLQLSKIDARLGWLGDPDTYDVAAYPQFKGNKAKATWLPDEATAHAWQEYLRH
jgi:pimeloyl-ACP methyl ester carboxylesterase